MNATRRVLATLILCWSGTTSSTQAELAPKLVRRPCLGLLPELPVPPSRDPAHVAPENRDAPILEEDGEDDAEEKPPPKKKGKGGPRTPPPTDIRRPQRPWMLA